MLPEVLPRERALPEQLALLARLPVPEWAQEQVLQPLPLRPEQQGCSPAQRPLPLLLVQQAPQVHWGQPGLLARRTFLSHRFQ